MTQYILDILEDPRDKQQPQFDTTCLFWYTLSEIGY